MTLQEARNLGYRECFQSWERRYVSRRTIFDPSKVQVHPAGGIRRGLLFYRLPSWRSSQYCYRQYLRRVDNV